MKKNAMKGIIRYSKIIAFLFFLMALNTFAGNFWGVVEKVQDIASVIEKTDFDIFRIFKGGQPSDPSHFGDF